MGNCDSKKEVEARLKREDEARRKDYEIAKGLLGELDAKTRVPHLLIELRSLGFVELQGKNTGGIYEKLDSWLRQNWRAQPLEHDLVQVVSKDQECGCCGRYGAWELGTLEDHRRLCDKSYTLGQIGEDGVVASNGVFKARGDVGENNMGKLTMQVVHFMTNECGWTLQVCDAGNLGFRGGIREQQIKFKAPHPLNLIAPHIMVELRQVGYIEINGPDTQGIHQKLSGFFREKWKAGKIEADPNYCDVKFTTSGFGSRGSEGENNMGLRTMEVVDFMVKECQWTLICCNAGNFGRKGTKREQQLVFRKDEFVQHGSDHVLVELRTCGYIEMSGFHDAADLRSLLDDFCKSTWGCKEYAPYVWETGEKLCEVKYTCPEFFYKSTRLRNNLGKRTLQLAEFVGKHGWALLLCNGGSIQTDPGQAPNTSLIREQQIKFTRARTPERAAAPLLMIELRTDPTCDKPATWEGSVEISGPDTNGIYEHLRKFIERQMHGKRAPTDGYCDCRYLTDCFRLKPSQRVEHPREGFMNGESNLGKWTMRLCDFMVDHLGEWDLLVCNSDNLGFTFVHAAVTAREMQLVFRHRPGGRLVFMSTGDSKPLGRQPLHPPRYWTVPGCLSGEVAHQLVPGTEEELAWMQEVFDRTFKHKATRDRKPDDELPDRLVAVQCVRSEHPELWDRYAERRREVAKGCQGAEGEFSEPRTMQCEGLRRRCVHATVGNPANQAYLLHGTNPTSAVAILEHAFAVNLAGKSVGTMFGPGVYLAESCTKADEYACDDVGGEYDGLYAMLVCRAALGRPLVVEKPGDYSYRVTSGEYHHVIGDREQAAGTFREFVLFHEASLYPEYAVFYRRERGGEVLPPPPRAEAPSQEGMH